MNGGIKKVQDTATQRLEDMVSKGKDSRSFIKKHLKPFYIDAQRERFDSENVSQGSQWEALSPKYAKYKLKKYATFPGGGRKINVATGRLYRTLTFQEDNAINEMTDDRTWIVIFDVPYGKFVNEARPVLKFNNSFTSQIREKFIEYMRGK